MSLYRLKRFSEGDGSPIDTSDAFAILQEFEDMKKESYNAGLNTAMSLVEEACDYVARMVGLYGGLMTGLENSKK